MRQNTTHTKNKQKKWKNSFSSVCKKHKRKLHIDSVRLGTSISLLPLFRAHGYMALSLPFSPPLSLYPWFFLPRSQPLTHPLDSHLSVFCQHICQFFLHSLPFLLGSVCAFSFSDLPLHTHTHIHKYYNV